MAPSVLKAGDSTLRLLNKGRVAGRSLFKAIKKGTENDKISEEELGQPEKRKEEEDKNKSLLNGVD